MCHGLFRQFLIAITLVIVGLGFGCNKKSPQMEPSGDPVIAQMIWHQEVSSQPTRYVLQAEDVPLHWERAKLWLEKNINLPLMTETKDELRTKDPAKGDWEFGFAIKKLPLGKGYLIQVSTVPGKAVLKKKGRFMAQRLAYFMKTGKEEKPIGPQVNLTILEETVQEDQPTPDKDNNQPQQ